MDRNRKFSGARRLPVACTAGILTCAVPGHAVENWIDHGIAAPVGMSTWGPSTIATEDRDGTPLVFAKIWTGYKTSYLFINAKSGATEQIHPEAEGWGAYSVFMAPGNIVYDTMGDQLVTIDIPSRTIRRLGAFDGEMALSYTQTPDGTIYAGIYPTAELVSFNPATDVFINHGPLNTETWPQYFEPLTFDAAGWIYGAVGLQEGQIVAFHPASGEKRRLIPPEKRRRGQPELFRGADDGVYANAAGWGLHRLAEGNATPVDAAPRAAPAQNRHTFPDGSRLVEARIADRELRIAKDGNAEPRVVEFDYESIGVPIYTIVAGPGGKIYGATGIPLRVWSFDPAADIFWNRGLGGHGGHINQFARMGNRFYGAVYSGGQLLRYDPLRPFDDAAMDVSSNPELLHRAPEAEDLYGRPNAVLAHSDGRHVLVGGKAKRVLNGSGLLVFDTKTGDGEMLDRNQLLPDHGINAMTSLSNDEVLIGTSIHPPTGGSPGPATGAVLYRFDLPRRTITGQWPLDPESPAVLDLLAGPDGLVYGLAEPGRFFVFAPATGTFPHQEDLAATYGTAAGHQAPRCLTTGPDGKLYALFRNAVVRINPETFEHQAISRPPQPITGGIAILDGRLYFACDARLFSCAIPSGE